MNSASSDCEGLVGGKELSIVDRRSLAEGHQLDEAYFAAQFRGKPHERRQRIAVVVPHQHRIDADLRKAGRVGRPDAVDDRPHIAAAGQFLAQFRGKRVEAGVEEFHARTPHGHRMLLEQHRVGGHCQLGVRALLANCLNQPGQPRPQQRFAAGDANLIDWKLFVQNGDQRQQFFVGGKSGRARISHSTGQDGNSGTQVTAVGDR